MTHTHILKKKEKKKEQGQGQSTNTYKIWRKRVIPETPFKINKLQDFEHSKSQVNSLKPPKTNSKYGVRKNGVQKYCTLSIVFLQNPVRHCCTDERFLSNIFF